MKDAFPDQGIQGSSPDNSTVLRRASSRQGWEAAWSCPAKPQPHVRELPKPFVVTHCSRLIYQNQFIPSGFTWAMYSYVAYSPSVSYTHLRAHETVLDLVCRLLLE